MRIFPRILAVFVGVFTGGLVVWFVQVLGQKMYPPPAGLNFEDKAAVADFIANAPIGSALLVILAYALGAFVGGFITQLIFKSRNLIEPLITGSLLLVAGYSTIMANPHPTWMLVVSCSVFLPFAYLGGLVIRKKPKTELT